MWARRRLEIGWFDLAAAVFYSALPGNAARSRKRLENTWADRTAPDEPTPGLVALSVRTAWDAWLRAMAFPAGSEIVISGVTIPEMARIIELNGLKCVPIAVGPNTLSPDVDELASAITPRTRAVLVAHLFGVRLDLSRIATVVRRHGLWLAEDCAQAFGGSAWTGSPEADVSLFSFGPIKTQTALGGALVRVRDSETRERMAEILESLPTVSRFSFAWRALKYSLFKLLITRWAYSVVRWWCSWRRRDLDQLVRQSVRNFPADELLQSIRRRPSPGLVRLLSRRIRRFRSDSLRERMVCARQLQSRLQTHVTILGGGSASNVWWVFPVLGSDPDSLVSALRSAGFDASRAHSLTIVRPSADDEKLATDSGDDWLSRTIFLPCYREMPPTEIERLADVVIETLAARGTIRRHVMATQTASLPVRAS
jgi:perosamine synthetase